MDDNPLRRKGAATKPPKPRIWAEGSQRPPFVPAAFARATLHYAREAVGLLFGVAARATARLAATVASGAYRLPADKLGRAAPFVPSYPRVASWIMASADLLARSGFIAHSDPDGAARLRASVPPLDWSLYFPTTPLSEPAIPPTPAAETPASHPAEAVAPVTLMEPAPPTPDDPLASIRAELAGRAEPAGARADATNARKSNRPRITPEAPKPPAPRSALADGLIDAAGFALGWAASLIALPYGVIRAGYGHLSGEDLRKIAAPE